MACVWQLRGKSPYWIGQFADATGKRRNRSTKQTDRRKAQIVVDTWEKAAKAARAGELTQAATVKILAELLEATGGKLHVESIAGFLDGWLAGREKMGRAKGTMHHYRSIIGSFLAHLGPRRGAASIASLSATEIEGWRNAELARGVSATTADNKVRVLGAALNSARRKGLALANPAEAVESAGGVAETREPFTGPELTALLGAADAEWRGMILLGAWCGLRIADAAGLTWGNVDLDKGLLAFQPAKTRRRSAEPLRVAMHAELVAQLETLPPGVGNAPLFLSLHGQDSSALSKRFSDLMRTAKIIVRKGRAKTGQGRQFNSKGFHALRHTMISRFADANVPADVRQAMAGHSSDAMHRKYVHLNVQTQRDALAKLPGVRGQPSPTPSA